MAKDAPVTLQPQTRKAAAYDLFAIAVIIAYIALKSAASSIPRYYVFSPSPRIILFWAKPWAQTLARKP